VLHNEAGDYMQQMQVGDIVNVFMENIPEYWRGIVTEIKNKDDETLALIEGTWIVMLPVDKFDFRDNCFWERCGNGSVS
jgi:hypothetical protein